MLQFSLCNNLLEVRETLHGFCSTKCTYWYYDVANWTKSTRGQRGDQPHQAMTENEIAWVTQHYLPKVQATSLELATA